MANMYEVTVKIRAYGEDEEDAMAGVDRHLRPVLGSHLAERDTDGYEISSVQRLKGSMTSYWSWRQSVQAATARWRRSGG